MKWTLSKQEIIAIQAFTAGRPSPLLSKHAAEQQRNIAFDTKTGEIFATNGFAMLMVGTAILPRGRGRDLVIVPPEALDHHRTRAKRPNDVCELEILDKHVDNKIMVTPANGTVGFFSRFNGAYPPVHQVFQNVKLAEKTRAAAFPADQLELIRHIARATGEKHIAFAGGAHADDPVIFSTYAAKNKYHDGRRWVVIIMPSRGSSPLAEMMRHERALATMRDQQANLKG